MSLSTTGFPHRECLKNLTNKVTTLNPNAAEFVPSALRASFGNGRSPYLTRPDIHYLSGEAVSSQSKCSISNKSDDEIREFWDCQLPDDITPDFKLMEKDDQSPGQLTLAGLSLHDVETSEFSAAAVSHFLSASQEISLQDPDGLISSEEMWYSGPCYGENQSSSAFLTSATNNWGHELGDDDLCYINGKEENQYSGEYDAHNFSKELASSEDAVVESVQYLMSQFPGFSAESLVDVYYANDCDLKLTIEILTQLETQVDGRFYQDPDLKASTAPSLSMLDFPELLTVEAQNGLSKYIPEDVQGASNEYSSSTPFSGAINLASAVCKLASRDSGSFKIEKKGAENCSVGSSTSSQVLTKQYDLNSKLVAGNKLQGVSSAWDALVWLETGEAVANMYSVSREEARDFACLRNAFFEQAGQAYLTGNKALAKQLSAKGQFYNMQMKAAHGKVREAIFRQRNPGTSDLQGYGQGQDCLIDLHGLHVSEAIHILKHELSILRSTARSARQRLKVMICVGTGHHSKGSRTPARLPIAVEQFLVEEGLHYTQPQPGLLRVVIY
ncbi:polyadenylate-binding protein-interacting protein 7-like isoform X1 [Typha angustifolia]|uniref:polyadenylate-binding protein-interacting protein 7-like isoform X1 n=1 Tax=Typha angustifolia TaxID=59011 RepID=UPI003C300F7F